MSEPLLTCLLGQATKTSGGMHPAAPKRLALADWRTPKELASPLSPTGRAQLILTSRGRFAPVATFPDLQTPTFPERPVKQLSRCLLICCNQFKLAKIHTNQTDARFYKRMQTHANSSNFFPTSNFVPTSSELTVLRVPMLSTKGVAAAALEAGQPAPRSLSARHCFIFCEKGHL